MVQAYGGDEGWAFIEEASYKLVIDTILPESEESKREVLRMSTPTEPHLNDNQYHSIETYNNQGWHDFNKLFLQP